MRKMDCKCDKVGGWVLCCLFFLFFVPPTNAQVQSAGSKKMCERVNTAFQSGEEISYDLYFNWKFIWIKVGHASLSVKDTLYNNRPAYQMDLYSISSKKADRFFKMRDTITSVMSQQMQPIYYRKGALEGKRYRVDQVHFFYGENLCYISQLRQTDFEKVQKRYFMEYDCVYDMLTILAQARSFTAAGYTIGDRIPYKIATGSRIEVQTLIFRGRKRVKAKDGNRYRCLVFDLVEKGKEKEETIITFFVTDDKNHLPVRLDMHLNFGSAKAYLKEKKGVRYPFSSIVD
ncbi:MAG: DUF3108 domain-containing protein [Bacteroidaceae bacterium]|nr:DUF3108 domain-containing protein [Bacteroidaceae bacterium]